MHTKCRKINWEEIKVRRKKLLTLTRTKKEAQKYMARKSHLCHRENDKKKELSTSFETKVFSLQVTILDNRFYQRFFFAPSISCSDSHGYILRE